MKDIRLGYGNYGMCDENIFAAIPKLATIGYEAIELTLAEDWPTAPSRLNADARRRLAGLAQEHGFPNPVLMELFSPFAGPAPHPVETLLREPCRLAADLKFDTEAPAILSFTLGSGQPPWETGKNQITEWLTAAGHFAAEYGVTLAVEPHVGGSLDTPDKAAWLIKTIGLNNVRLNLDISHFLAQGMDILRAMELLTSHAVYAHVKEARFPSPQVEFLLPGQGTFDFAPYFQKLRQLNYRGIVAVEVSGMIWRKPDYQPWLVARQCFDTLHAAITRTAS